MESASHNLPARLSQFVGREREIAAVKQLLAAQRLVTLTGAGGCGKTRLALEVAAQIASDAAPERRGVDGVWLVELAPLADPALILPRLASVLEVRERQDQPLLTTLTHHLRALDVLIVLDNCEHLIEASAQVAEALLHACPELSILATSREALNVAGESVYRVPSLSLPPPRASLAALHDSEAARLFVERAQSAQASFALMEQNAPAVAHICQRLDGIPLAIELAAARLRVMSLEQIVMRLEDVFQLLTGGSRTALARQQTLRATLDWSHDLLAEPERVLFRRLAVFAGGWIYEAAEAVCGEQPVNSQQSAVNSWQSTAEGESLFTVHSPLFTEEVFDLLTRLVDKSLVLAEEREGEVRLRLLEPIRQYAREKLEAAGEAEAVQDRHLAYFVRLAEQADPELLGGEQPRWQNRLESEHDNMRAALQWAIADGQIELGARLAGACVQFWRAGGHYREGVVWYERLLATAELQERSALRAAALSGAGCLAEALGRPAKARSWLEESVAICRELGQERGLALALRWLGYTLLQQGDLEVSRQLLEECIVLSRAVDDHVDLAFALLFLGALQRQFAEIDAAKRCLEESLALFRTANNGRYIGFILSTLGDVALDEGNLNAASVYYEEGLALQRAHKNKEGINMALYRMGWWRLLKHDDEQASAHFNEALTIQEEAGSRKSLVHLLRSLGYVALLRGQSTVAAAYFQQSLLLSQEVGDPLSTAWSLVASASAAAQAQPQQAARLFGAVNAWYAGRGWRLMQPDRIMFERGVATARAQLAGTAFDQAWREGGALKLEQAVALAEQVLASAPSLQAQEQTPSAYPAGLTAREIEVLRLLARGLPNEEIARQLVLSTRTVHSHLRSIFSKLDVTTRTAAARVALDHKLV